MKILIADDDADDRNLAALAFNEVAPEHELQFVNDGQELINHLYSNLTQKEGLPDLVLLDLNMPKKDGRLALKEIKSDPALKQLDVVIFSTSASSTDKDYTLGLGASDYLVKPSDYTLLLKLFRNLVTSKEQ